MQVGRRLCHASVAIKAADLIHTLARMTWSIALDDQLARLCDSNTSFMTTICCRTCGHGAHAQTHHAALSSSERCSDRKASDEFALAIIGRHAMAHHRVEEALASRSAREAAKHSSVEGGHRAIDIRVVHLRTATTNAQRHAMAGSAPCGGRRQRHAVAVIGGNHSQSLAATCLGQ